ncbi:MAG: J domain-containing protein [Myxococcota bacterium]
MGTLRLLRALLFGRRLGREEIERTRCYVVLECPIGADLATVRRAYHRLVRRVHPDVQSSDPDRQRRASELTARLTRAYETLGRALGGPS